MSTRSLSWVSGATLAVLAGGGAWWWLGTPQVPGDGSSPAASATAASAAAPAPVPLPLPPASAAVTSAPALDPGIAAQRIRLVGMASGGGGGMALIEVDGQTARSFRVGDRVDGNLVLREVSAQGAVIGPREGGAAIGLQITPLPQAVTSAPAPEPDPLPNRDLSDGSIESEIALRKRGGKNAPMKPPSEAEQASAAQASVPTDPGRWRPPGQP